MDKIVVITGYLGGKFVFADKDEARVWIQGIKHALWTFGHFQNGVVYVGTGGKTYKQAVEEIYAAYEAATGEPYEQ